MAEYIEREAAIKAIYESDPNGIRRTLGFNVGQIEEALRAIPAVDVAPVRNSYWESYETSAYIGSDDNGEPKWSPRRFYVCHNRKCRRKNAIKSKFCPNCGARMDGAE